METAESEAKSTKTGLQLSEIGFCLDFSSFKPAQLVICCFTFDEYWIVMNSLLIDAPARQPHNNVSYDEQKYSLWRQLHSLRRPALYMDNLKNFESRVIVVSITDEKSSFLSVETHLKVIANVVPVAEVDVFTPGTFDPSGMLEILGNPISRNTTGKLT